MTEQSTSAIDPRIADRRDEVQREHRRRWLVRLGWVSALLAALALGIGATRSPLLDVDTVDVVGADRSGRHTVLSAVGELPGTAMIDVDAGAIGEAVSTLPWVASVEVRREWPSTVVVEVTERTGVAVLAVDEGTWQTIDRDGRVLAEQPDRPPGLVALTDVPPGPAPGARLEGIEALLEVAAAVRPEEVGHITGVRLAGDELVLELAPGGIALLGDTERLEEKIDATVTLLASVDDRCMLEIDVRVPGMPTITRDDECAGATPPTTASSVDVPLESVSGADVADPTDTPEMTGTTLWVDPTQADGVPVEGVAEAGTVEATVSG